MRNCFDNLYEYYPRISLIDKSKYCSNNLNTIRLFNFILYTITFKNLKLLPFSNVDLVTNKFMSEFSLKSLLA